MGLATFFSDLYSAVTPTEVFAEAPSDKDKDDDKKDSGDDDSKESSKDKDEDDKEGEDGEDAEEEEEEEEEPEDPKPKLEEGKVWCVTPHDLSLNASTRMRKFEGMLASEAPL